MFYNLEVIFIFKKKMHWWIILKKKKEESVDRRLAIANFR